MEAYAAFCIRKLIADSIRGRVLKRRFYSV